MVGKLAILAAVALLVAPLALADTGGTATATLANDSAGAMTGAATFRLRAEPAMRPPHVPYRHGPACRAR